MKLRLAAALAVLLALLTACAQRPEAQDTWTICWYLCGSNLETFYGCASDDLAEVMQVKLPKNIRLVIETGGAAEWHNDRVQSGKLQRHLYDRKGLTLLEELPQADMGQAETLQSFLSFCRENYPADHTAVIFWNHGGGSVAGAAFDEVHQFDALTLDEFSAAFSAVYPDAAEPPFELVGFDACLMATLDVAYTFRDYARYLVASEELEPGNGWNYTGWLQALADDPAMDGAALGKVICDTFLQGCEQHGTEGEVTLSVTDLGRIEPLVEAYDAWGNEALLSAVSTPSFFGQLGRSAQRTESYGGNNPREGYTNMADLGALVANCADFLPQSAQAVGDALRECIVYRVSGPYRKESTGLSCYYSYSASIPNFADYSAIGASEASKYLYAYGLSGRLNQAGQDYVRALGYPEESIAEIPTLSSVDTQSGLQLYVDEDAYPILETAPGLLATLRSVRAHVLSMHTLENGEALYLDWGQTGEIEQDWESGRFRAVFDGKWAVIGGTDTVLPMNILYSCEEYDLYYVEVMFRGERRYLHISRDNTSGEYRLLGLRDAVDAATGMADKNFTLLRPGDELTPCYRATADLFAGEVEWDTEPLWDYTLVYTEDTQIVDTDFTNGEKTEFLLTFELEDTHNKVICSDPFYLIFSASAAGTITLQDAIDGVDTLVIRAR